MASKRTKVVAVSLVALALSMRLWLVPDRAGEST